MKTNFLILSLAATAALTNFTSCIDDEDMDATSQQILDQKKKAELLKAQAEEGKNLHSVYLGLIDAEADYQEAQSALLKAQQDYNEAVVNSAVDIESSKRTYTQKLAVAEYNVAIYEKQIEDYKEAIANYQAAGNAEQIEALNKEIEALQAQLDAVNVKRAEYKAEIENQNAEYASQIKSLQYRLRTIGDENGNITYPNDEKLASWQAKIYELEAQKDEVQAEYDEWKDTEVALSFTVLDYSVIENAPLFDYSNGFSRDENIISGDFKNSEIISSTSNYYRYWRNWSEEVDGSTTTLYCYIYDWYSSEAMFEAFYATLKNITEAYSNYSGTLKTQYNMLAKLEKEFTDLYEAKVATRDDYEKKLRDLADEISDYEQQKSDYISDINKQINILYGMMPSTTKAELENEKNELTVKISGKRSILNVYVGIQNEYYNYEDGLAYLNNMLQNAQSNLVNAQNNVATYKNILEKIESGLWDSAQYVESLKIDLESAQKKAETAKSNLDYYTQLYEAALASAQTTEA